MTDETNTEGAGEGTETKQNDGVITSATSNQDPLPPGTPPNPIASGEGTTVLPKEGLHGERREKVWQELRNIELALQRIYGTVHNDVMELIHNARGHLTTPNN